MAKKNYSKIEDLTNLEDPTSDDLPMDNRGSEVPMEVPKKYWQGNTYIPGFGLVSGEATPDQIEAFEAVSTVPVESFLRDYDPLLKMTTEAKRKRYSS